MNMTTVSPFSAFIREDGLLDPQDMTAVEVKQAEINPLFHVVSAYPGIHFSVIDSANSVFGVHWKTHQFELTHQTEEILISQMATELMTLESAGLMAQLLFSLAFNRKVPGQIQTHNRAHEQILWTVCTQFHYILKAQRADQRSRFDLFANDLQRSRGINTLKQLERNQHLHIEEEQHTEDFGVFAEHLKQQKQMSTRQLTQLILATDQRNPFFNLLIELRELSFNLEPGTGNIVISLGDAKFSIEKRSDLFNLNVLSTTVMKPGMAELLARILEFLVFDYHKKASTSEKGRHHTPIVVRSQNDTVVNTLWQSLNQQFKLEATTSQEKAMRQFRQANAYAASQKFSGLMQRNQGDNAQESLTPRPR